MANEYRIVSNFDKFDIIQMVDRSSRNYGKYNVLKGGEILSHFWYDDIVTDGSGRGYLGWDNVLEVKKCGRYNILNGEGVPISSIWFDNIIDRYRCEGDVYNWVVLNDKKNLISKDGVLMLDRWVDNYTDMYWGGKKHIIVCSDGKYNVLWKTGYVFSTWLDSVKQLSAEWVIVKLNKKLAIIDGRYHLVIDMWFDDIEKVGGWNNKRIVCKVVRNGKFNYIKPNGGLLFDEWFDNFYGSLIGINQFNLIVVCKRHSLFNYVNLNGEPISKIWFNKVFPFEDNGIAKVHIIGKGYNWINTNGELISDTWFNSASGFRDNVIKVRKKTIGGYWATARKGNEKMVITLDDNGAIKKIPLNESDIRYMVNECIKRILSL